MKTQYAICIQACNGSYSDGMYVKLFKKYRFQKGLVESENLKSTYPEGDRSDDVYRIDDERLMDDPKDVSNLPARINKEQFNRHFVEIPEGNTGRKDPEI